MRDDIYNLFMILLIFSLYYLILSLSYLLCFVLLLSVILYLFFLCCDSCFILIICFLIIEIDFFVLNDIYLIISCFTVNVMLMSINCDFNDNLIDYIISVLLIRNIHRLLSFICSRLTLQATLIFLYV